MAEEEKDNKITIEIKITIPTLYGGLGNTVDHFLKATEEIIKAGKSIVAKPEIRSKVRKIEVK
jgi:hypothetical protein